MTTQNPFAVQKRESAHEPAHVSEEARAIQEVQASLVIAKRFQRNPIEAMDRILDACTRPTLAEGAMYRYVRGGTEITGPSIRLAEAIAQAWGNISFGMRELSNENGQSLVEAFAWDLETNTRQVKVFTVKHRRHTKKGGYDLTDPRDIYEMVANQGARRLRACILGIIPGDVIEAAIRQCEETLQANIDTSPEAIKRMVDAFGEFGVTRKMIEARIQCRVEAIRPAQMMTMRKIYNSLKDGMSSPEDWFDLELKAENDLNKRFRGEKNNAPAVSAAGDTSPPVKEPDNQPQESTTPEPEKPTRVKTRPKVIEKFKAEIDLIETSAKLDMWRMKHQKRIIRELPKEADQDAVFSYAEQRFRELQAKEKEPPAQDSETMGGGDFVACPNGNGNVPVEYCEGECPGRPDCPVFSKGNSQPSSKLTMEV